MSKKYTAFTLIELLIVMGILVILLVIGVTAGRYAYLKAQDTKHKDNVRSLYVSLLRYKQENGKYPILKEYPLNDIDREMIATILGHHSDSSTHLIKEYIDEEGGFDGGSNATYYYGVDQYDQQFVVVCVSLGGIDDAMKRGFYCTGDGIGLLPDGIGSNPIPDSDIGSIDEDPYAISVLSLDDSDWDTKQGGFGLNE